MLSYASHGITHTTASRFPGILLVNKKRGSFQVSLSLTAPVLRLQKQTRTSAGKFACGRTDITQPVITVFTFAHPPPFGACRPVFVVAAVVVFFLWSLSVPQTFVFVGCLSLAVLAEWQSRQKTNGTQFDH